jgi:hypothetical protein
MKNNINNKLNDKANAKLNMFQTVAQAIRNKRVDTSLAGSTLGDVSRAMTTLSVPSAPGRRSSTRGGA